jgi:uncharacterized protein (DUF1684 family)
LSAVRPVVFAGAAVAALWAASACAQSADYAAQVEQARAERVTKLKQADGYLTLIASGWLEPGDNTVGAAADNRFQVPRAAEHLGVLHLSDDGSVELRTAGGVSVTVDGKPVTHASMLTQGGHGERKPTRAYLGAERYLYVVESGKQRGLRVKDNAAQLRTDFPGIPYFPIDPSWKIEAQWQAFTTPHTLRIANVVGTETDESVPGQAVFERDGQRYTLTPMEEDGRLFFVFSDRTAGKLTYGGARFLYADKAKDGKVVLDFNLAENPPCAITPHVVCPLAPPENRLRLEVNAGEKKFQGAGH